MAPGLTKRKGWSCRLPIAGSKGAPEISPPSVNFLSLSRSFRGKFGQIIGWQPDLCSWCSPSRKCWLSRWIMYIGLQQYIDPLLILLVLHFKGRKSLYLSNWSRYDPSSVNVSTGTVLCNGDGWEWGVLKLCMCMFWIRNVNLSNSSTSWL